MIPTVAECINIMDKYKMLPNIKAHSIMVAKVAYIVSSFLVKAGNNISIKKTVAASLLHDIGKTEALKSGKDHTEIGVSICMENGFYEIKEIIAEHVILKEFNMESACNEKEVVYYSDKRVNHDKIVSLDERLDYILKRYGKNDPKICEAIRKNFMLCRKVEKKIFKKIPLLPQDIPKLAVYVIFDEEKGLLRWQKEFRDLK